MWLICQVIISAYILLAHDDPTLQAAGAEQHIGVWWRHFGFIHKQQLFVRKGPAKY